MEIHPMISLKYTIFILAIQLKKRFTEQFNFKLQFTGTFEFYLISRETPKVVSNLIRIINETFYYN